MLHAFFRYLFLQAHVIGNVRWKCATMFSMTKRWWLRAAHSYPTPPQPFPYIDYITEFYCLRNFLCPAFNISHILTKELSFRSEVEQKRSFSVVSARALFSLLGCLMVGTLVYILITDGSPFRQELFTPWVFSFWFAFFLKEKTCRYS